MRNRFGKLLIKTSFICLMGTIFLKEKILAQNDEWIERVVEHESSEKNAVLAKKEILEEAILKTSESLIEELVGESKASRNKLIIQNKILKNSARFIPFTKTGELIVINPALLNANSSKANDAKDSGLKEKSELPVYKMAVTLKIRVEELKKMLLENGLFYENDGSPIVLTFIKWIDGSKDVGYSWWLEDSSVVTQGGLKTIEKSFETYLKSSLQKNYFYLIRPGLFHYQTLTDKSTLSDLMSVSDMQAFAQKLGAQVLIKGQVLIKNGLLQFDLEGLQVQNLRAIAQVSRKFSFEKNKEGFETVSQEISGQILEAWQKGSLGASVYRLSLNGRIPPLVRENIKEFLKSKLKELKNIKERYLEYSKLTFDIESSSNPLIFKEKLTSFEYMGFKFNLESANEKEAIYRLQ